MSARETLFEAIQKRPGIHFRELQRITKLTTGQVQYHLSRLLSEQRIAKIKAFNYLRYFPIAVPREEREILAALRIEQNRVIIEHILNHEGEHCSALTDHVSLALSTISWHVSRLEEAKILYKVRHGKKQCIHLRNADLVRKVLDDWFR